MKKLLLIVAIGVLGFTIGNAQATSGDFELGLGAGVNFAGVSDIEGQNTAGGLTSFNIGAIGEYYFSDRWGIKAKLTYDSKGWGDGFITSENFDTITTDFKLNYLTIPIMANWHFGSTRKWYLNFGPYIGILLNAEDSELGLDLKESFKSTDIGLALGIGYKFNIAENTKLYIEYDEQAGFTDIFEENNGDAISNRRSSFNVGILFIL